MIGVVPVVSDVPDDIVELPPLVPVFELAGASPFAPTVTVITAPLAEGSTQAVSEEPPPPDASEA